ncbi:MAG: YdiY family protein [Candidatus Methylomirabilales bacterium]
MASQTHDRPGLPIGTPYSATQFVIGRGARLWFAGIAAVFLLVSRVAADEVKLTTNDVLHGTVVEQTEEHVVLEHPLLGSLNIPRDQIASLDVGVLPPKKEEKPWKLHVDLALKSSTGNTDEQSLLVGADATRETADTRLKLDLTYYLGITDDETTDNRLTVGATHDWLFADSRWFYFVKGRYDYDQFESWDQRIAGHTGPGYHLIDVEALRLDLRAGMGARKEFGSQNDDLKPEALVGADARWQISPRQSIDVLTRFLPALNDLDDYRTRTTGNWRLRFSNDSKLSVTVGFEHEYQNVVDPDKSKNDLRVFAGLGYDL